MLKIENIVQKKIVKIENNFLYSVKIVTCITRACTHVCHVCTTHVSLCSAHIHLLILYRRALVHVHKYIHT